MSAIGPTLPPHLLAKRKRREEEEEKERSPAKPIRTSDEHETKHAEKRTKILGPAMPPAPLDERPTSAADDNSSSDDDDFGPAMPTSGADTNEIRQDVTEEAESSATMSRPQRDEWMTMAPSQDDLAARMDPSRVRARGFNTGRSARGGGSSSARSEGPSAWHETAEQKQKRLADEVLGITTAQPAPAQTKATTAGPEAASIVNKEQARGPSLLAQHRDGKPEQAEDDISQRAFDREKDMGSASRITGTQKREMLNKASDYSSRFAGGSYL